MILTPIPWQEGTWSDKTEEFLGNKKKELSKSLTLQDKIKQQIDLLKEYQPFIKRLGEYKIKDLSAENAKSWTAFKIITENGIAYKLRITENEWESKQTDRILEKHKQSMPEYLWKETFWNKVYYLFERKDSAKEIDKFIYEYKDPEWISEPEEIHKKAGKLLGEINQRNIHKDKTAFQEEFEKRIRFIKKQEWLFTEEEIKSIKEFFKNNIENVNLRFWDELWDAHTGNIMLEESNPHKAYAIDEWSIQENYLIGLWISHYLKKKNLSEDEIKKFLRWYYKKNPTMIFDRKYFEFIYVLSWIRKMQNLIKEANNKEIEQIKRVKENILSGIRCSKEDITKIEDTGYLKRRTSLYTFVKVNEELKRKLIKGSN
jgi:hypothetical protein